LPPFVIPAKAGIQRRANGKTAGKPWGNAINRIVPDLDSRFRGNDEKESVFWLECAKLIKSHPQIPLKRPQKKITPRVATETRRIGISQSVSTTIF
jgi:hypothetical protein